MKNFKENGITLIALVITIIILLILAGVTVGMATSGTGLFEKAKEATEKYKNAADEEQIMIANMENVIDETIIGSSTRSDLLPELIWTNSSPTDSFAAQTISLNLTNYKYVIIVAKSGAAEEWFPRTSGLFPVVDYDTDDFHLGSTANSSRRFIKVKTTGIEFSSAKNGTTENNTWSVPYKIYGIKGDLNIDIYE